MNNNEHIQSQQNDWIEYLKNSDLPLVLYGTAVLANYVKYLLDCLNIKIDFVAVDKEYLKPNMKFHNFEVLPLEDVLANNSKINIIMAFIDKTVETRYALSKLNNFPNVQKCMFFDRLNIREYLLKDAKTQKEKVERVRGFIKINPDIYLKDEETARAIAENWNGEIKKPSNLRFIKNAIPVVLAANEDFAPYLAVMLQSVLDNSNPQRIYHFIIFERSFTPKTKSALTNQVLKYPNCEIDFIDVTSAFDEIPLVPVSIQNFNSLSIDTYSRFFIPYWFDEYPKVIYLDSDMIAKTDISELYDLDIKNHCMGSVRSPAMNYYLERNIYSAFSSPPFIFLEDWSRYINAGVLVFDTKKFSSKFPYTDFLKFAIYFSNRYAKHVCDQDILAISLNGDFFALPPEWNYVWSAPKGNDGCRYLPADPNTKIIHFTTVVKPWKDDPRIENNPDVLAYREYAKTVPLFKERVCLP